MKKIREDIKKGNFSNYYLLYGKDDYMKKLYKEKLKIALTSNMEDMNYSYYTGENIDIDKVVEKAQTLPFFSERRVLIFENTTLFSESNTLADYLDLIPDTTYMVFVENDIDKRNKLFKRITKVGYVVEMDGLRDIELMAFAKGIIKKENIAISDADIQYLIYKIGKDMNTINNECEKLCSYVLDKGSITREDIDAVCITTLENRVFEMLDALANGDSEKTVRLYNNLLELREPPARILNLIERHFKIMCMVTTQKQAGSNDTSWAAKMRISNFLKNYINQARKYSEEEIKSIISTCVELEEGFKTGNITDQLSVEIMIAKLLNRENKV